ncbi:DUF4157 domain-containing protein [Microbacterium sp. NPDC019599]|uniref:eCIS core domain-containing protein n=1 Tax=Microbacterium sp. NPDC019599 TaxID=3154690 RepID=UPI0033CA3B4C
MNTATRTTAAPTGTERRSPGLIARAAQRALAARRQPPAAQLSDSAAEGAADRAPLVPEAGERVALPYRTALEERFGRSLGDIDVYAGPRSAHALQRLGAVAATTGRSIVLARPDASMAVVAHEIAHVLQARRLTAGDARPGPIEPAGSRAEREATVVAAGEARSTHGPVEITEGLSPGATALLRQSAPPTTPTAETPMLSLGANPAVPALEAAPSQPAAQVAPAPSPTASVPATATPAAAQPTDAGVPVAAEPAAALPDVAPTAAATAPMADPAQAAAQQAAAAAAQEAIAAAATPADRLRAYAAAPPSVKATQTATLSSGMAQLAADEGKAVQAGVPAVQVALPGAPALAQTPASTPAPAAPAAATELVPPPAPAAAPPVIETPEVLGAFRPASDAGAPLALASNAPPETLAARIDDSLAAVPTADTEVPRTAGAPPPIALEGESDPARVRELDEKGRAQGAGARDAAARAVREGPGPEHIKPVALEAAGELPTAEVAAHPAAPAPAGPEQFAAMQLPPDVQASFDQQQGPAMEQSLAGAVAETDKAAADRDVARQEALDQAHAGEEQLRKDAESGRAEAVTTARGKITTARDQTLAAQDAELARVEGDASKRKQADATAVQREVDGGRKTIDADFAKADTDIKTEVTSGEQKATAEKQKAERDAQKQSWWDRAVDFVKSAISSLVAAVGKIFDAVRAAVNKVLDAVKKAALAVIAGVAKFVKAAIAAFGEFLKAAITGLIGQIFPGLAAKLNSLIDSAVALAQKAVDVVADKLSKGVSALVEGLRAGLNKVIDVFQAGVDFAVGLAVAAITGDWGALFRKVLEAVLRLVGVEPEQFYAFVGRAEETLGIIVNNPLGFVGNLAAAVKGGIVAFAGNIGTHLKEGVVGWLTGALGPAGITIPKTFDLVGVLDLARQILGLTWENLKAKAVKLIGEKNVERIEQAASWIGTLVTEGWSGLWTRIMADLASLRDAVFDGIRTFIQERVIMSAITKLASLLNPVGAIVQLVLAAWNLFTFLRDQLARLVELVRTVVDTIGDIARGILDKSMKAVEGVLGRLLPLAIDLLARLIGLGNVGGKVREILEKVRGAVDKAIDKLIAKVVGLFKGGKGKGGKDAAATGRITEAEHPAYAEKAFKLLEEKSGDKMDPAELKPIASGLEPGLTKALAPGIKLTFLFTGGPDDAADGDVQITVRIAPNTTNALKHKKGSKASGLAEIGEISLHGAQRRRYRGGDKLLEGESEHVIPYAVAVKFLQAAGFENAKVRAKNRAFDKALTTIVIYERAARIKTKTDNPSSEAFGQNSDAILKDISGSRAGYDEADSTNIDTKKLDAAWDKLTALLTKEKTSRVKATNKAVSEEHGEAYKKTKRGAARGEKSPTPVDVLVSSAAAKEYQDILAIAEQTFQAVKRSQTPDRLAVITRITLAQLNDAKAWPAGALAMIENLGARTAQKVADSRAAKKFASVDDLTGRKLGITQAFLKRVKP